MDKGWIFLYRKFTDWEWYDDINTKVIFIHCLLKANWKDKPWRGMVIKRGAFVTSLNNLALETGLSVQNVRTCLEKLEKTREINKVSTSTNTTITIVNYDSYQDSNKVTTSEQQTSNKRVTTTKSLKPLKEVKEEYTFDVFWDLYDKKLGRRDSENKWNKLSEKEKKMIMEFVPIYVKGTPDKKFRKHPITFFNQKTWEDDWHEYKEKNSKSVTFDMRKYL